MKNQSSGNAFLLALACCAGLILSLIASYPGFVSTDGLDQYQQSISGRYSDWHPPAMAFFWSILNKIHQGQALMLLYQLLCFWGALYLLMMSVKHWGWRLALFVFAFAPFVQNFLGYITKDIQMALSWLLAFAILFKPLITGRRIRTYEAVFSVLLLLYGTWVRANALPGVLPLWFLWSFVVFQNSGRKIRVLAGIGLLGVTAVGPMALNNLLKPEKTYPHIKLYLHDLTGIYVRTGENVFPGFLYSNAGFDTAYLRQKYNPATFDEIWWNYDGKVVVTDRTEKTSEALAGAWLTAIKKYPDVYLANRFEGFLYFLRIKKRSDTFSFVYRWVHPNDLGLSFKDNRLTYILIGLIDHQKKMPYLQPWFWFFMNVILCVLIPFVKHRPLQRPYIALAASGLLYILFQFPIFQTDVDFRYFYWNCVGGALALILFLADRYNWYRKKPTN